MKQREDSDTARNGDDVGRRAADHRRAWENDVLKPALDRFELEKAGDRFYGPDDLENFDFFSKVGFPGEYPFTAGIYATFPYATGERGTGLIPQSKGLARAGRYSGYGTAEDTAAYYRRMISEGQRAGPNVAFDLPTQCGYDSDDPHALGEVGRSGVAINSFEDFKALYEPFQGELEIDRVASNWTINAPAIIIIAMYVLLARQRGIDLKKLRGTPQNDILKEYIARGTFIFPPRQSMRIVRDIFAYCTQNTPSLNLVSFGGYHIREAGATREQDLGFSMANGIEYLRTGIEAGLDVDVLAPRMTVNSFGGSVELFKEVAFQRAARRMWATIVRERFGSKNPRSWLLRQPSGAHMGYYNATMQRPLNNLARAIVGGIASALGGAAPNVEPPFDEPLGLGWSREAMQLTEDAARILQYEAKLTDVRDPLAGSYYIESLTDEIENAAWEIVDTIEKKGGAVAAIEEGWTPMQVTESAINRKKAILSGEQIVVGVNAFTSPDEVNVEVGRVVNPVYDPELLNTVEERQVAKLNVLRARRDPTIVASSLRALDTAAKDESENLFPFVLQCVESLCTVGEICNTLRDNFGEYRQPGL